MSAVETGEWIGPVPAAEGQGLQRVAARGELGVRSIAGRSFVSRNWQEGAARIRLPKVQGEPLEAILINTAGGLTGGDRLDWQVTAEQRAQVSVTTQACEKLYRASGGEAHINCRLKVRDGARIAWLPQETIVYDGSASRRRIEADIEAGGSLLMLEATILGRVASGEKIRQALFADSWRVRCAGRLVHAEALRLEGDVQSVMAQRATGAGTSAFATVLAIGGDCERHLDDARAVLGEAGGASFWSAAGTGKLLARVVEKNGLALRRRLVPLIKLLNGRAGLPTIWTS